MFKNFPKPDYWFSVPIKNLGTDFQKYIKNTK